MQSEMTDRSSRGNDQLLISTTEIDASQESVYTRLRTQVEFYFSPKNLSRDTYLRKMLTSEHLDIPTPRPAQYMCPVGIITNFPKVKDICSQFSPRLQKEPAALLLARALEGSNSVVTISSDGNWIGPVNQILPPPTVLGVPPAGMEGAMGQQLPPRIPPQFPPQGYQHPPPVVDSMSNPMHQGMMGTVPPPPPPPVPVQQKQHQHRGEGQGFMYQKQQERPSPMGSESPSSTSLESLPQHQQQQQAYVSNLPLPSSKNSVGGTQASLSSMSDVGAKGGQPMTFLGPQGGGVTSFPQGPSVPASMMTDPNTQPPNAMPPPLRMFPPLHPWPPGGIQHPPQPFPYYHPQQMQHAMMYSQQGGGPPQQMQQMPPYPTYSQMGFGVPHLPPQQFSYPPPFSPYQGMQQYVDYGGGGGMQYHGYPPPPPPHPSQFHDNRYLDAPGGYFHNNDQHQHYGGGGGGQKKRVEKKKHKNNQQPQHQQQHNTQRDSYGSSTSGTTGSKNNESEGHHNNFQRRGSSPTPPIGEHHRGGSGGDKFKKSGSGEQHSQYRRDNSNSSPSGFNNRSYNRQKQQHQHSDRSSSSDAIPSTSSNSQQRRQSKADENKEIFTSSDFPGLGGGEADEQQLQSSDKKPNSNLVGYASALLKKKDVPKAEESKSNVGKSTASTSPSKSAPSPTMKKAENQSHETDDIGQEIQAGLQELSLVGNDGNVHADSKQRELSHGHDNDANETDVCRTSTCAAGLGSEQTDANNSVSNSPARPDSGGMDAKHELKPTSESLSTISLPVIDVFNSDEFPAREAPNETGNVASRGTLPPTEIAAQPSEVPNDPHSTHRDEKPKPTGAWGSKRLFADVIKDQR